MAEVQDIEALLKGDLTLPSLPGIITRVLALLEDDSASLRDVGELLSTDPGTAVRVLRVANSAAYGLRHQISSVEHAVPMLGAGVVRNLCLTATVMEHLQRGTDAFLRHSVCTGVLMEILTRRSPAVHCTRDEAFIFGLLHKLGVLLFLEHMPRQCEVARAFARDRSLPLYKAEREVIGADYAELGARVAAHWQLPVAISDAIAGQHEIARCPDAVHRPYAALLQVAHVICMACGLLPEPEDTVTLEEAAWVESGLALAAVPAILEELFDALPGVDALLAEMAR